MLTATDFSSQILEGIPADRPEYPAFDPTVSRAPDRSVELTPAEEVLALANALRYFPADLHTALAEEFLAELHTRGRIYMYRYRPSYPMSARPIDEYPAQCQEAAAIMAMIQNNLDPAVAQHPYELITYGGNGTVFQNWAQYRLTMQYLAQMSDQQTLVLHSGHPVGLFPSSPTAPRLILTCGMMVPNYSTPEMYAKLAALGVTSYGQMTAGSFMYIGPQGIVHGTTITLLNAGRKYLGVPDLTGKLFVTSGLGGMSGAQGKASVIAGAVAIIAEVDPLAAQKRLQQGWIDELSEDLDWVITRAQTALARLEPLALGYLGNVVDLWEALVAQGIQVDLGSDQTSLHNPFGGGYYPVDLEVARARELIRDNPEIFKNLVQTSLRRQVEAINTLVERGMHFWDYGNAFLLEAERARALIRTEAGELRYRSYVEDLMGPLCFDYGFGPFRWVCLTTRAEDLATTDRLAAEVIEEMLTTAPPEIQQQLLDNLRWIKSAANHQLVVGSQARILYADLATRVAIALKFNRAIREGQISGPLVLGRDHHDVGGTDSPHRETTNILDGSQFCADMAVHTFVGNAVRRATWVSLHNGGGVGWGEAINGGFGLFLDGSLEAEAAIKAMIPWDVGHGLARRAWAGNQGADFAIRRAMAADSELLVTMPRLVDRAALRRLID